MSALHTAQLELLGAEQRVRLARRSLKDFLQEQAGRVYDADLAQSLDHERESLECELDAAQRRQRESLAQFQELRDRQEAVRV